MRPRSNPLVSVIVCVYNAGAFLRPAVLSILAQTYDNLEIIVFDDGSTDDCMKSIENLDDPRIVRRRHPNAGKSATLNTALSGIRGEFYVTQDADDLSHPSRILAMVEAMQAEADLAALFTGYELIVAGKPAAPRSRAKDRHECARDIRDLRMPGHDPTAMYRVAHVRNVQYDPRLRFGEGLDYILQVGEVHPMAVLGKCLYSYRIHSSSLTKQRPTRRLQDLDTVLRKACTRRGVPPEPVLSRHKRAVAMSSRHAIADNNIAADFMESAVELRDGRRYSCAFRVGLACARLHPLDLHYYKPLAYSLLPGSVRRILRPSERDRAHAGAAQPGSGVAYGR